MGKDSFISVSGEYRQLVHDCGIVWALIHVSSEYTCFANKLSRLTRLRGPIRSMGLPSDLLPENNAINAPREIMRLVNWMMSNFGNSVYSLFVIAPIMHTMYILGVFIPPTRRSHHCANYYRGALLFIQKFRKAPTNFMDSVWTPEMTFRTHRIQLVPTFLLHSPRHCWRF